MALLCLEVGEFHRLQARLGLSTCASFMGDLCDALGRALGARGRISALGEGRLAALIPRVLNTGHGVLAAEKLARTADELFARLDLSIKPQLYIGVALLPADAGAIEPQVLLQRALIAAEAARMRRSRVMVFDEGCEQLVIEPWTLGNELARAIECGELSFRYQPKVAVASGYPAGAEALTRWERDGVSVASPDVFIPIAAETGLLHELTWVLLNNALRASNSAELPVAVNISAETLHHRDFPELMRTALSTWQTGSHAPTIEVTEGALVADFEEASVRLNQLRDLGARVAIDDFGTGYSSLGYFKRIPADELKIDKSFVRNMVREAADLRVVRMIVELARHFNLQVVAEGVEDWETYDAVASLGCDYIQGHLFARAMDLDSLREWIRVNRRDLRRDRSPECELSEPATPGRK